MTKKITRKRSSRSAKQKAVRNPNGQFAPGHTPPGARPFKPGQSGNPKGRPRAGLSVVEWINELQETLEEDLRKISTDPKAPPHKRSAANSWLAAMAPAPDMADFGPLMRGEVTIEQLRASGVDTSRIKKVVRRTDAEGNVVSVAIELHEHGGRDLDRLCDRTAGKPTQPIDAKDSSLPDVTDLNNRLKRLLGNK